MAEMGRYCKAYEARRLREFSDWSEALNNLRPHDPSEDGEPAATRTELLDDDVLFVQENYVVTDGIAKDEYVIFDEVTEEWKRFCHETLDFEIPEWEPIEIEVEATSEAPAEA